MSLSFKRQWKNCARAVARRLAKGEAQFPWQAPWVAVVMGGGQDPRSTTTAGKARAQVGTSVVAPRLPMSGELRSGSHSNRKEEDKKRVPPIHVRYRSEEEVRHVKDKAEQSELSVNGYIRATTLDHLYVLPYCKEFVEELRHVKRQLTGIGINLNQLAHKANISGHVGEAVIDYLEAIRDPVIESLKSIRRALSKTSPAPRG